ncbi:metallophosphoesterase [Glaesserella sp.]|uniref:metallophosphoesterase n=1 Tax=Glaesserella sp. TaxID=2094731 RepID=UPI00359F6F99
MELRYYITIAVVVIGLQLLLFNFTKTISWLFNLSKRGRWITTTSSYLLGNAFIILNLTRIFHSFRLVALMLAILLFALFVRLAVAAIYFIGKRFTDSQSLNRRLKVIYPIAFFGLIGFSLYNAYVPTIVRYSITLDKPMAPIRIGVASDFHLGILFGGKQLDELAKIFEQEKVDLILLPGDIMDDNVKAYLAENMQPHLEKLRAPLGVYATMGNHDLFGAEQAIRTEIEKAGIKVLWDQAVTLDGKFAIIGRNDDLVKTRPSTKELLTQVNTDLPVLLMDHRPTEIEKHAQLPIDLQVSGHTHKGQIFPANMMTSAMYPLSYGYEKIGLGHYVVTSGYGFWGIPMRLGSQSEVVIIDIKGK